MVRIILSIFIFFYSFYSFCQIDVDEELKVFHAFQLFEVHHIDDNTSVAIIKDQKGPATLFKTIVFERVDESSPVLVKILKNSHMNVYNSLGSQYIKINSKLTRIRKTKKKNITQFYMEYCDGEEFIESEIPFYKSQDIIFNDDRLYMESFVNKNELLFVFMDEQYNIALDMLILNFNLNDLTLKDQKKILHQDMFNGATLSLGDFMFDMDDNALTGTLIGQHSENTAVLMFRYENQEIKLSSKILSENTLKVEGLCTASISNTTDFLTLSFNNKCAKINHFNENDTILNIDTNTLLIYRSEITGTSNEPGLRESNAWNYLMSKDSRFFFHDYKIENNDEYFVWNRKETTYSSNGGRTERFTDLIIVKMTDRQLVWAKYIPRKSARIENELAPKIAIENDHLAIFDNEFEDFFENDDHYDPLNKSTARRVNSVILIDKETGEFTRKKI